MNQIINANIKDILKSATNVKKSKIGKYLLNPSQVYNKRYDTGSLLRSLLFAVRSPHFNLLKSKWGRFTINYGINGLTDSIYAQEITLNYDSSVMDFESAKSLREGIKITRSDKRTPGKIHLIIASEGAGAAVTGDTEIIELTFRAKKIPQAASGTISVSSAILADAEGNEFEATATTITLFSAIAGDLNLDGKVSVGDLAIASAHYGKSMNSADWEQIKLADINGDGLIDLIDLNEITKKINP